MKIGFLVEPYEETNASGMGYVAMELVRHLLERKGNNEFTLFSSREIRRTAVPGEYKALRVPKSMFGRLRYFLRLKEDVDVLIFNVPLSPLVLPRRIKSVLICQEIISLKLPRTLTRGAMIAFVRDYFLMPLALKRAAKIVVPSVATKELLMQVYKVPEEKIALIYNGFQDLSHFKDEAEPVSMAMTPYFLFTGKVKERKNVHGIVSAFVQFKKKIHSNIKLVLAGDYEGEYYENLKKEIEENGLQNEVFFLGYVTGAPLYSLYKEALALVFPSFSEGFGMPIVESFAAGSPVITATIAATAEVSGGAALLVDPHDPSDIARAMERIYSDAALRAELIQKGYERAKVFSWPKAAAAYGELIQNL